MMRRKMLYCLLGLALLLMHTSCSPEQPPQEQIPPPDYWLAVSTHDDEYQTANLSSSGGLELDGSVHFTLNGKDIKTMQAQGGFMTRVPTKPGRNTLTLSGNCTNQLFIRVIHTTDPSGTNKVVFRAKISPVDGKVQYAKEFDTETQVIITPNKRMNSTKNSCAIFCELS